jgi:nitrogenase-associated protein
MALIIFYEKPGCINNTKQKALLKAAGHTIEAYNLLAIAWTVETLRPFFGDLPISEWFNNSAPRIKSGEIIPPQLDEKTALNLMINDPLLIRRPLLQVGDRREVGFDQDKIASWIGLKTTDTSQQNTQNKVFQQNLETCPKANQPNFIPCQTIN